MYYNLHVFSFSKRKENFFAFHMRSHSFHSDSDGVVVSHSCANRLMDLDRMVTKASEGTRQHAKANEKRTLGTQKIKEDPRNAFLFF